MRRAGTLSGPADRSQVENWIAEGLGRLPGRFSRSTSEARRPVHGARPVPGRDGPGLTDLSMRSPGFTRPSHLVSWPLCGWWTRCGGAEEAGSWFLIPFSAPAV